MSTLPDETFAHGAMTSSQRALISALSAEVHGSRTEGFLSSLRHVIPDPTREQVARWIESLKEQATSSKPKTVIFDYDGTLCDVRPVRHYVQDASRNKRNYDAFHRASNFCPPNEQVVRQARAAKQAGYVVLGVTARMERHRLITEGWNEKHGIEIDHLVMRSDTDRRPDYYVKRDILARLREQFNVVHATDDNPAVIRLWVEEGIETTLVPGFNETLHGEIEVNFAFP